MTDEDKLWGLQQAGRRLELYVEEFLELANQLSWHDAALGACFQLGLDHETIRCDFPVCDYPLIELINLVLYLNGSNFEEIKEDSKSRCPAPSETRHVVPAHLPHQGSDRLPSPKYPGSILSTALILSPELATSPESLAKMASLPESPAKMAASPMAKMEVMDIMDKVLPLEFTAPILSPSSPLVPSSPPESPTSLLVPSNPPVPVVPERPPDELSALPWLPELSPTPWSPKLPDPPWLPELSDPPWHPELPDPPWLPELSPPAWSPELPDPLWLPKLSPLPWPPSSLTRHGFPNSP
ncbi:hypothetical protein M9458_025194 [Cirrhinus mrigala]|uniref:Uncharacterized protein n=1 Tax=Cirrhinus mrigala TaxID=683832 RepID=A0ABD0Q0P0_CIRMR